MSGTMQAISTPRPKTRFRRDEGARRRLQSPVLDREKALGLQGIERLPYRDPERCQDG